MNFKEIMIWMTNYDITRDTIIRFALKYLFYRKLIWVFEVNRAS